LLGLLDNGRKAADVAREYGIHVKTIYRWVDERRLDGVNAFPGKGNLKPGDRELRDLMRQVKELEEENAISKKRRPSLQNTRNEVCIHTGTPRVFRGEKDGRNIKGITWWILSVGKARV